MSRVLLSCVIVLVWHFDVINAKPSRNISLPCKTETCLSGLFDENITAIYDSDATNIHGFNTSMLHASLFAAFAIKQDGEKNTIFYVAERYDIHAQTKIGRYAHAHPSTFSSDNPLTIIFLRDHTHKLGLTTSSVSDAKIRFIGADISAEDPRLLQVGQDLLQLGKMNETFVIFNAFCTQEKRRRCIMFTPFNEFQPQIVSLGGSFGAFNSVEKNWAPFAKDGRIMFVYSFDPLVIIECANLTCGNCCRTAYMDKGVELPLVIRNSILRGGSNLIPLLPNRNR